MRSCACAGQNQRAGEHCKVLSAGSRVHSTQRCVSAVGGPKPSSLCCTSTQCRARAWLHAKATHLQVDPVASHELLLQVAHGLRGITEEACVGRPQRSVLLHACQHAQLMRVADVHLKHLHQRPVSKCKWAVEWQARGGGATPQSPAPHSQHTQQLANNTAQHQRTCKSPLPLPYLRPPSAPPGPLAPPWPPSMFSCSFLSNPQEPLTISCPKGLTNSCSYTTTSP